MGVFNVLTNCTNATKSRKESDICVSANNCLTWCSLKCTMLLYPRYFDETSPFLWSIFSCNAIQLFRVFEPPAVTGRILRIRVWPSFCPSSWKFSWNWLFIFSETQHGVSYPCVVLHDRAGFF